MKTISLNIDDLKNINPDIISNHLLNNKWLTDESKSTSEYTIWKYHIQQDGKEAFVLLPLNVDIPDFSSRVYDLIKVLAIVENRSPDSIVESLRPDIELAKKINRDILNIRFRFSDESQKEILAGGFGKFLTSFQNLVNGIAESLSGMPSTHGQISSRILDQSQVSVIGTYEGSFGLKMASIPPKMKQLEFLQKSDPLIREAFENIFSLLKASRDNEQSLKEILVKLGKRSTSSYRNFLIALSELKTDNNIDWESPDEVFGDSIEFPYSDVVKALFIVRKTISEEPVVFDIIGEWIGGNKRQKNFEVKDTMTDRTYRGSVIDEALRDIELANISQLYNVTISEETSFNEVTQEITQQFTLLKLKRSND
jgi:hypothetical protein